MTADDRKVAKRISDSVRETLTAKTSLQDANLSDRERKTLEGEVEAHERRIDEAVFRLYGVEDLPK